ncbi:MAG: IS1380 family transposase [Geminicoccales bacterium]
MGTDCSARQLLFEGFAGRQVVGAFDGGEVTSNGGAPLLREADRAIGLTAKVAASCRDARNPAFVEHRLDTLLSQRIHAIALGHEDLIDHDEIRFDPALGLVSDTLRPRREEPVGKPVVATLAGKSTLNRLEHGLMNEASRYCKISVDDVAMERVFLDIYIAAHSRPPKRIFLDLDATDDPLHGHQEGRFFHGYYRCYCYLPLYIFDGRHLLVAKLRRANIDASAGAKEEIERVVAYLRQKWPEVEICLRADSGFARDELMSWCEENRVEYVFGLARNQRLEPMIAAELAEAKATFQATGRPARVFKDFLYRTLDSWSRERRVVAKAEHLQKGANPRFIVTSLAADKISGQELYERIYCARGEMENRIKECQLDLFADRTSAATMRANQLRLWFAALAYVLMEAVRRLALAGTELANATAGTIRLKLLKIGAVVTVSVRRIKLAFATACPTKEVFALALQRLRRLREPPAAAAA